MNARALCSLVVLVLIAVAVLCLLNGLVHLHDLWKTQMI